MLIYFYAEGNVMYSKMRPLHILIIAIQKKLKPLIYEKINYSFRIPNDLRDGSFRAGT